MRFLLDLPVGALVGILLIGTVLFAVALAGLLLERGRRRMFQDFSAQDRALIAGLLEERVAKFAQQMVGLGRQMLEAAERGCEHDQQVMLRLTRLEKRISLLEGRLAGSPRTAEAPELKEVQEIPPPKTAQQR